MFTVAFDLDGTLVKTDLLHEQLLLFVKQRPASFWRPGLWLLRGGRAGLKSELARLVRLRADILPYREPLVERARAAAARGDRVILASASAQSTVEDVARHLGCFAHAVGTTTGNNLKGRAKLERLLAEHGRDDLFYIGDSRADLDVWKGSGRGGIAVNPSRWLRARLARLPVVVTTMHDAPARLKTLARALRVGQWVKNLLLFLPLAAAHTIADPVLWSRAAVAALAFCLLSSSVYLLNDLFDLEADRMHPTKRGRPLAAGDLSIGAAVMLMPALAVVAGALAWTLSAGLLAILAVYLIVNLAYTLRLKQVLGIDVILLALLYSLRLFAGGIATSTPISTWLIAFTAFFFFALAVLKRYVEVRRTLIDRGSVMGRDYRPDDEVVLLALGIGGHLVSLLVLALYFSNPDVTRLYPRPDVLWLLLPLLLYWVMRVWVLAHRGEVDDDPVMYTIRDRATYAVLAACGAVAYVAATA